MIYNANGALSYNTKLADFLKNCSVGYYYDDNSDTYYSLIRINKVKIDGTIQTPFVYAPNGVGQATQSALDMNSSRGFYIATNAGIGGTYTVEQGVIPIGVLIENNVLLQQGDTINYYALTIDANGDLNYAEPNASGSDMVANGIVSAVVGFVPIVVDYDSVDASVYEVMPHDDQHAQRQIIGQFGNGDYAIISCEGRNFQNSAGWTIPEAISVCIKHNIKFAYNLDGGGSVETVIYKKQLNTIYEGSTGRKVQNYIVFNGTNTFGLPD